MSGGIFLLFAGFALIVTLLYGFGLIYHWLRFGFMYPLVYIAMPIYLAGSGFLILVMLGALATL